MSPSLSPPESGKLVFLSALFILLFFIFFSYSGLFAYFTFDDGTAVVANQRHFEVSMWRNLLNVLTVFTTAYRPLGTFFWRPLYAMFGYNPLPYRVAMQLIMALNFGLAYVLARRLEVTREAAALTTLIFCYNASMADLFYDTCTVTDVICFTFYALACMAYVLGRQSGNPLTRNRIIGVVVFYALALDSKELAVAIPGILTIYEVLYHYRDFRDKQKALRVGGVLLAMFVIGAIYLKVKVADMGQNAAYAPHATVGWVVKNVAHYVRTLLYIPDTSVNTLQAWLILVGFMALAILVRSRAAVFGVLFFVTAVIPVAVIARRAGYCAYIPYFGLALAAGAILANARAYIMQRIKRPYLETRTAVMLFLVVAVFLTRAHMVRRQPGNGYFEWTTPPVVAMMDDFRRTIPEFPPDARVLLAEDPWPGDWGQMFLVELMYHDKTIWVDRPKNLPNPPDPATYDLVVSYKPPDVDLSPLRVWGFPMKWELRGKAVNASRFAVSSPNAHGAMPRVDFSPQAVRTAQTTTVTVPGVSNTAVNALFRIVSGTKSTPHLVKNWCTVDAKGSCTITAPQVGALGAMVIDWIQPVNQRWIFTSGVLTIVE
jgi:hypothetical protein